MLSFSLTISIVDGFISYKIFLKNIQICLVFFWTFMFVAYQNWISATKLRRANLLWFLIRSLSSLEVLFYEKFFEEVSRKKKQEFCESELWFW